MHEACLKIQIADEKLIMKGWKRKISSREQFNLDICHHECHKIGNDLILPLDISWSSVILAPKSFQRHQSLNMDAQDDSFLSCAQKIWI